MRFLIDAQLPPRLAWWLRDAGHEADHVEEVGLRNADDSAIWRYALENKAVLITKDEDFAEHACQTQESPIIIWVRIGNVSTSVFRQWFMPQLPQILAWIQQGVRVGEIR